MDLSRFSHHQSLQLAGRESWQSRWENWIQCFRYKTYECWYFKSNWIQCFQCVNNLKNFKVNWIQCFKSSDTKGVISLKQVETGNRFLGVVHARDYRWNPQLLFVRQILSQILPNLCFQQPIFTSDDLRARATGWARRRRCWTSTCWPTRRRTTTAESLSMRSRRSAVSLLRWLFTTETWV